MNLTEEEYEEERRLLIELESRNVKAFVRLYNEYKDDLEIFAYTQLNDRRKAIETVVEFFEDMWEDARFVEINPPIYKYLVQRVRIICDRKSSS